MHSNFYKYTINQSIKNLGIETIDIHYIHDPEVSKYILGEEIFLKKLESLIEFYETQVNLGYIRFYGMATWDGFLSDMNSPWYLSLEKIINTVYRVVGQNHHFKFIQLPYNIINTRAKTFKNQYLDNELYSIIEAANKLDIIVTISSPLNQMEGLENYSKSPCDLLNYVIETEGIFSTMVGMKKLSNLRNNLDILRY